MTKTAALCAGQVLALALGLLLFPAATHAAGSAAALLDTVSRSRSLEKNLRVLCDEIGGRMPGTPAMKRAVDWAVESFREAGVDKVETEPFTIANSWREGKTKIEVLSPVRFDVRGVSSAWVPATPRRGLRAEVLDGGSGREGYIRRLGSRVKGKILLVRSDSVRTFLDLANEQRDTTVALREAAEMGAAAVLFMSTRPRGLLYRHVNVVDGALDVLPTALIAREDAERILRLIEAGRAPRMRLALPNKTGGAFHAHNVVAEIQGSELPEETVIVGAHLDSWDLGTGCLDNGANAALVVEMARGLAAASRRPKRSVRFILFSGEEQGLLGSKAYVRAHRNELDSVVAVIVHDMGGGKIKGYSLGGRRDIEDGLVEAMEPVSGRGANAHSFDAFFGSDHFDFLLEGIPTLIAIQDTTEYVPNYHSSSDTYDKIDLYDLRQQAGLAAVTVFNLADRQERLGKRLNRAEMEELIDETGLDDQLKFLGLWEEWENGSRGRAKGE
jgi:hypothetical protein